MGMWGITLFSALLSSVNSAVVAGMLCFALLRFGVSRKRLWLLAQSLLLVLLSLNEFESQLDAP